MILTNLKYLELTQIFKLRYKECLDQYIYKYIYFKIIIYKNQYIYIINILYQYIINIKHFTLNNWKHSD